MIHLQRWLIATGVMIAAYLGYAVIFAPWLEPPPLKFDPATKVVAVPVAHKEHDFSHLFPPGSWQLNGAKVIETETCFLLFNDYQPQADGRLEVLPCTVLMFTGKDAASQKRPIVLDAPAGAILKFDRELDVANAKVGELLGGTLPGEIRIFQHPSSPTANDGLELTTRTVQIDMKKLHTPSEVRFRYGPSYGIGRDLTIRMLPQEMLPTTNTNPFQSLQSLELAIVDVVHLESPSQRMAGNLPGDAKQFSTPAEQSQPPIEIRCKGQFQFDFVNHTGSFHDQVHVTQLNPHGPPDSLRCDVLAMTLRSPEALKKTGKVPVTAVSLGNSSPATNYAAGGTLGGMSAEQLQSQLAYFSASGDQVILNAPSQGIYVSAAEVTHDFRTHTLRLDPGRQSPQVTLRYGPQSFVAQQLTYVLPEKGRLGNLVAVGPGEARVVQAEGTPSPPMQISWQKELRLQPNDKGPGKLLSLLGRSQLTAEGTGTFAANELYVWLREKELPAAASPSPAGSAPLSLTGIEPERLLATGMVDINAAQLIAHTNRFEAWFIDPPAGNGNGNPNVLPNVVPVGPKLQWQPSEETPGTIPIGPGLPSGPTVAPPDNSNSVVPIRPISAPAAGISAANFGDNPTSTARGQNVDAKPSSRFDVTGDLIRAKVFRGSQMGAVEELAVEGKVRVVETQGEVTESPLTMLGDILQMERGSTPDAIVQIVGKPAQVTARGMKLVGASIKMHRGDNRVWIEGQGEADIPLSRDFFAPPGVPQIPQGPNTPAPLQLAKVTWKGGAKFDGQTLTVAKDVVARTEQDRQVLLAQLMTVTLDRYVDFQKSLDRPPQIATLRVDGGVDFENRTFEERTGVQLSYDRFQVKNFTVDQRTGEIKAEGPGWFSSSRTGGSSFSPVPAAVPRGNEVDKLTYLRATFQGNIVGSITNREIQFQRQVQVVVGPIANWKDEFNPRSAEELGENGVILTSDQITVAELRQANSQQNSMEFTASGNTLVEGKGFVAKAQRIAYSTGKEQLIVEGEGRTPAELWYRAGPGKPEAYQRARKIKFMRRQNSIEVEDAHNIDLNQINGPAPKLFGK